VMMGSYSYAQNVAGLCLLVRCDRITFELRRGAADLDGDSAACSKSLSENK